MSAPNLELKVPYLNTEAALPQGGPVMSEGVFLLDDFFQTSQFRIMLQIITNLFMTIIQTKQLLYHPFVLLQFIARLVIPLAA